MKRNHRLSGAGMMVPAVIMSVVLFSVSCGGPQSTSPSIDSVSISPKTADVVQGETLQFTETVTVTGGAAQTVAWTIEGAHHAGTTISNGGLLTVAPAEASETLTIKVASTVDAAKFDTAVVTVTAHVPEAADYNHVWIVGMASPTGWNLGDSLKTEMTAGANNTFTWTGTLKGGDLEFAATKDNEIPDFSGAFFLAKHSGDRPTAAEQDFDFNIGDSPNRKWKVVREGTYSITLNTAAKKIAFTAIPEQPAVNYTWLVGGATPGGWNLGSASKLTLNAGVFTWTGTLYPDEFKIAITDSDTSPGGWDGAWFVPDRDAPNNKAITGSVQAAVYTPANSGTDEKWTIPNNDSFGLGIYTVTLDPANNNLTVVRVGDVAPSAGIKVEAETASTFNKDDGADSGKIKTSANESNTGSLNNASGNSYVGDIKFGEQGYMELTLPAAITSDTYTVSFRYCSGMNAKLGVSIKKSGGSFGAVIETAFTSTDWSFGAAEDFITLAVNQQLAAGDVLKIYAIDGYVNIDYVLFTPVE